MKWGFHYKTSTFFLIYFVVFFLWKYKCVFDIYRASQSFVSYRVRGLYYETIADMCVFYLRMVIEKYIHFGFFQTIEIVKPLFKLNY